MLRLLLPWVVQGAADCLRGGLLQQGQVLDSRPQPDSPQESSQDSPPARRQVLASPSSVSIYHVFRNIAALLSLVHRQQPDSPQDSPPVHRLVFFSLFSCHHVFIRHYSASALLDSQFLHFRVCAGGATESQRARYLRGVGR